MNKLLTLSLAGALLLGIPAAIADDGEIHPTLEVTDWFQNWEYLQFTVDNPGDSLEEGVVVIWFYDDGNLTGWGLPVEVPTDCVVHYGLRLPEGGPIVGSPGVYKTPPDSITDAPDPVMQKVEPREDEDGGGKGGSGT
jgi:hypothetical protein